MRRALFERAKSRTIAVAVEPEMYERIARLAARDYITVSTLMHSIIVDVLAEEDERKPIRPTA